MAPTIAQDRDLGRAQRFDLANDAVATPEPAPTARATPHSVAAHTKGICVFERLDRRVEAIGHVTMGSIQTIRSGTCTHPAGDRLVVREATSRSGIGASKSQVAHCSVARRRDLAGHCLRERAEHHVHDALRGFDVPAGNGCGHLRVHERPLRRDHLQRTNCAVIRRDRKRHDHSKTVHHGRQRDGINGVHASGHLLARSGKVDSRLLAIYGDRNDDGQWPISLTVVVHAVLEFVDAVRNLLDRFPDHPFGVILQVTHVGLHRIDAVLACDGNESSLTGTVRRDLRCQVSLPLYGRAHIGEDQVQNVLDHLTITDEAQGWNPDSLLIDGVRQRHRSGGDAAHIGMMCPIRHVERRRIISFHVDRLNQRDIREVGATAKRIVDDHYVSRLHRDVRDGSLHRQRHRAKVHGHMLTLCYHVTIAVEHSAGVISSLFDVRRERCTAQGDPHLLRGGVEQVAKNLERYGVPTSFASHTPSMSMEPPNPVEWSFSQ